MKKKHWFLTQRNRRKAVSTMIGGIIILTLVLTALTTMVLVTQQYDAYQTILNQMSQKDIERFSESLQAVYPGIGTPTNVTNCGGGQCIQYNMTLNNLAGIGTQVARIYINNTDLSSCYTLCIFDPSNVSAPYRFHSSLAFINPNEVKHVILFWLPSGVILPIDTAGGNTVSLATTRGRVFSFPFPFPPAGVAVTESLHIDAGPFRIIFDPNLITYTIGAPGSTPPNAPGAAGCANTDPSPNPCLPGGWEFPTGNAIVFYVRISNIGGAPVKLLAKSYLVASPMGEGPGSDTERPFYVINPMNFDCWDTYFKASWFDGSTWPPQGSQYCPTPTFPAYPNWTYKILNGSMPCLLNSPCYTLPESTLGQPGQETYVLFSAATQGDSGIANSLDGTYVGTYVFSLVLSYYYVGYHYQITIPLLSCYNSGSMCRVSG